MTEDKRDLARVLWTGGFDSTLRILQLSYLDIDIQPYYFTFHNRKSKNYELEAIHKITEIIKNRETTKANLLPVKVSRVEDYMPVDQDIVEAHKRISKKEFIAPQYQWIAQVAKEIPGLQLSVKRKEGESDNFIHRMQEMDLDYVIEHGEKYFKVSPEEGEDYYKVFGNLYFPENILMKTKQEEMDDYIARDAEDVAAATWFCHYPVDGEPCGFCLPCRNQVEELGLYRLTEAGQKRYKHWRWHLFVHRVKKLFGIIFKDEEVYKNFG